MKFSSYQESLAREAKQRGAAPNCAPCRCGSDMQRWSMFDSTVRAYLRIICEACDFAGPSAQYSARTGMLYYQGEWHVGNDRAFLIDLWNRAIAGEDVADQYETDAATARRLDEERAAQLHAWHFLRGHV